MALPLTISSTFLNSLKSLFPGFSKLDGSLDAGVRNADSRSGEAESPGAFLQHKKFDDIVLVHIMLMAFFL